MKRLWPLRRRKNFVTERHGTQKKKFGQCLKQLLSSLKSSNSLYASILSAKIETSVMTKDASSSKPLRNSTTPGTNSKVRSSSSIETTEWPSTSPIKNGFQKTSINSRMKKTSTSMIKLLLSKKNLLMMIIRAWFPTSSDLNSKPLSLRSVKSSQPVLTTLRNSRLLSMVNSCRPFFISSAMTNNTSSSQEPKRCSGKQPNVFLTNHLLRRCLIILSRDQKMVNTRSIRPLTILRKSSLVLSQTMLLNSICVLDASSHG